MLSYSNEGNESILVESPWEGEYFTFRIKHDYNIENIEYVTYTKTKKNYVFIFKLTNSEDKLNVIWHYFAVRKSSDEVANLGNTRD